jgi:pSer/pThr/pTyr-binding forkhead associated (FHA) protein
MSILPQDVKTDAVEPYGHQGPGVAFRLVSLDGGPDIPVDADLILVGRHASCSTRLGSSKVSRLHCCLSVVGREVIVRDLGSMNGTRVNGRLVESARLRPGDELSVADLRYVLDA